MCTLGYNVRLLGIIRCIPGLAVTRVRLLTNLREFKFLARRFPREWSTYTGIIRRRMRVRFGGHCRRRPQNASAKLAKQFFSREDFPSCTPPSLTFSHFQSLPATSSPGLEDPRLTRGSHPTANVVSGHHRDTYLPMKNDGL